MEAIEQRITEQGNKIRSLKSSKADKEVITAEVAILNALKAELKALTLSDPAAAAAAAAPAEKPAKGDDKKGKGAFTLKNAKVKLQPIFCFLYCQWLLQVVHCCTQVELSVFGLSVTHPFF